VLYIRVTQWHPAELLRLQIDHSTSTDGGGRCLFQVGRLKHQVHVIGHLNNFTTHQAQLQQQVLLNVIWEEHVVLAQLCNKVPIGYNGMPQIQCKTAPPLRRLPSQSNTPIPRPTSLTILTAAGSNQPYCHSTLSGHTQTDRQTDRPTNRQMG